VILRHHAKAMPPHPAHATRLADLVVQVRVAVPVGLERHQRLDGGGAGRVQQRCPTAKQLRQHLRLRQAQPCARGQSRGVVGSGC